MLPHANQLILLAIRIETFGMSVVPDASAQADAHNLIEAVGMQAKCTKCGRPFVRTRPDKQFCSVSCRNAAQQANRRKARRQAKAVATKSVEVPAVHAAKKDWLTPARIEPRRRLSETDTAVRKRNRRRAEALADSQRADVVRELRERGLNADQIEAEIAKRQGQDAGR